MNSNDKLSNNDVIQFLQFEYDWQKQRRSDLIDKAKMFLCWNAAVFAFAIAFTDIGSIVKLFQCGSLYCVHVCAVSLTTLLVVSLTILAISSYGYFECLKIEKLNCFETEKYIDSEFLAKEICNDYKEIIKDYDSNIEKTASKVEHNILLMRVGIVLMLITEILLKILVSI